MTDRSFEEVQRETDETIWNLKGTTDREFRPLYLKKLRRLRILLSVIQTCITRNTRRLPNLQSFTAKLGKSIRR